MSKELIKQSVAIFDTPEKWEALFEIHNQSSNIIRHWLTIGALALRKSFEGDPVWGCEIWGQEWECRWYLKECGKESLAIGLGWIEVELHLHQINSGTYGYDHAAELLRSTVFMPLLELFEFKTPPAQNSDGCLASNTTFNPFSEAPDVQVRQRELAWLAAHETKFYVEKMGGYIRRLTADHSLTGLFRELNQQIRERTSANLGSQP